MISLGRQMHWLHDYLRLCDDCNDDEFLHFLNTHCSFYVCCCILTDNVDVKQGERTMFSVTLEDFNDVGCWAVSHPQQTSVLWVMVRITEQRTASVVTGPQGEEKGKLRKPNIWLDCAAPLVFFFYWRNVASRLEQMLAIMAHAAMG